MRIRTLKKGIHLLLGLLFLMGMPVFADQGKININTANEKQLCQLKRIGPSYAARIIEYRDKVGEFKTPEEIMKVQGVGSKTFEANKDMIIVQDEMAADVKKE
ncbi:MAG: helix-hairpin-helix domain-containing protein [bacterium]